MIRVLYARIVSMLLQVFVTFFMTAVGRAVLQLQRDCMHLVSDIAGKLYALLCIVTGVVFDCPDSVVVSNL